MTKYYLTSLILFLRLIQAYLIRLVLLDFTLLKRKMFFYQAFFYLVAIILMHANFKSIILIITCVHTSA